jgi:hypothetical protein
LGDYKYRAKDGDWWLREIENRGFKRSVPLYIATDALGGSTWATFFHPITTRYNVTFHETLKPRDLAKEYAFAFPRESRNDFFGFLEQLVCVCGDKFMGSGYSTFSAYIEYMRRHRQWSFPEVAAGGGSDGGQDDAR